MLCPFFSEGKDELKCEFIKYDEQKYIHIKEKLCSSFGNL